MKKELTNRQLFFLTKERIKDNNFKVSDNEIYQLLLYTNNYQNYTELVLKFDEIVENCRVFENLLEQVISGKPIQYVLNQSNFLTYDLYVDENVLIPRPETELLVLDLIKIVYDLDLNRENIVDVCTGSGAIAIALKKEFQSSNVYGSDIKKECLKIAEKNALMNNCKINFLQGDKLTPLIENNLKFDILISNPPYVKNIDDIEEKVKLYEPLDAIYVESGIEFYEAFFKDCYKVMKKDFIMAFEINYDQEDELTNLIKKYFGENVRYKFKEDIYNLTRYLFIIGGYENKTI